MSLALGLAPLSRLSALSFPAPLSMVVARVVEVFPAKPATNGSHQLIRVGDGALVLDLNLFDQSQALPQSTVGGFIRLSAPNSPKSLVVERSKASRPTHNVPSLVARRNCYIEIFGEAQACAMQIGTGGFSAGQMSLPLTEPHSAVAPVPAPAAPSSPTVASRAHGAPTSALVDIGRQFAECLTAARAALGQAASDDDVRFTARVIFDRTYGARTAA